MGFFARLRERARHAQIQRFGADEKRALVRLCVAVATADKDLSDEELDAARAVARDLGVDVNDASKLGLPEAIAILRAQPAHLELALLAVVDVIFADGDYDAAERDFVDAFAAKHGLPHNTLKEAVERRAKATADAALDQWHKDIVSGR
jgi:tellurite resistance protein